MSGVNRLHVTSLHSSIHPLCATHVTCSTRPSTSSRYALSMPTAAHQSLGRLTTACVLSAAVLTSSVSDVAWSAEERVHQCGVQEVASAAGFLDLGDMEKDPVEPFTLFGTTLKKYVIEVLEGNKIVSRQKGFTVNTCVSGYPDSRGSPAFNAMPTRDKVQDSPLKTCIKVEGEGLKDACVSSCKAACAAGVDKYATVSDGFTGFAIPVADKQRVTRACSRSCAYECTKPGKAFDFVTPYRR